MLQRSEKSGSQMARDGVNKKNGEPIASRVLLISSPVADAMCARIMLSHYDAGQLEELDS